MPRPSPSHRPHISGVTRPSIAAFLFTAALLAAPSLEAQTPQRVDRQTYERGRKMLEQMRATLREHYFDPTFGGLDLDARFEAADSAMKLAPDSDYMFAIIAQYLAELRDSHTSFIPPDRAASIDYGFAMQYVGDTCFVASVRKGSDAEAKGLKVGEAILQIDNVKLARSNYWTVRYVYYRLRPRPGLRLVVRGLDGTQRELIAMAKIEKRDRIVDYTDPSVISRLIDEYDTESRRANHHYRSFGDSVMVWKMNSFVYGDEDEIAAIMKEVKRHRALILDLRNNGGGSVLTTAYLLGQFFDRDIQIATYRRRSGDSAYVAKARDKDPYRGMVLVLMNSNSASASEVTARTLQLQGRGIIVGDRSMGAVVTSQTHWHELGFGRKVTYGVQVSVMDLIMPDGQRLESIGVIPDVPMLPSGADMAAKRDPVMAKALSMVGMTVDPVEAATVYRDAKRM